MTRNIGIIDRAIRALVGLAAISPVFIGPQAAWGWLGLVPLAAAIMGWCPPYALLGINTGAATRKVEGGRA